MTAPLEGLARLYNKKGYPAIARGLTELAERGRQQGMPRNFEKPSGGKEISWEERQRRTDIIEPQLQEIGISTRIKNLLLREVGNKLDITDASDLAEISDEALLKIRNMAGKGLKEIRSHFPYIHPIFPEAE